MNTTANVTVTTYKAVAPTTREAMRLVREKLGDDAVILSNKTTENGVELVGMIDVASMPLTQNTDPLDEAIKVKPELQEGAALLNEQLTVASKIVGDSDVVLREIHSMRGMFEEQLSGLSWNEKQRADPVRGHLLRTLLGAGFSARLAKDILESMPAGQSYARGMEFAKSELAGKMPVLENENAMMEAGGVYALMGPTGVGKTTTTAKLAARCVMRFGSDKLALVTTDSYRIGAYEQLRIYGQILGVSVHAVKDAADLDRVLVDLADKHMVLIDTVGMSQRDRAVTNQIAMLCDAKRPIKRLLLLNATSHGDTLNEVVKTYQNGGQQDGTTALAGCIFTKVDESTHPGALIDMAIRHQLPVHYISNGQKVPENLVLVDRTVLIERVFQTKSQSALFVPGEADLDERPASIDNDKEVVAAIAVSERWRAQCSLLIRALTDNAEEMANNAKALSNGAVGFDNTRVIWRQLDDETVGGKSMAQNLLNQVIDEVDLSCSEHILAVVKEVNLGVVAGFESCVVSSNLLLSDQTGLPIAAPHQLLTASTSAKAGWIDHLQLGKPVVHLLSKLPSTVEIDSEYQGENLKWVCSIAARQRVIDSDSGLVGAISKLAGDLNFCNPKKIIHLHKNATVTYAEMLVHLISDVKGNKLDSLGALKPARCVISRLIDDESGKTLGHSYLLASSNISSPAEQVVQWPIWRANSETFFRLLKQGVSHISANSSAEDVVVRKVLLVSGQASTTVFRLQQAKDDWAQRARASIAQLAGQTISRGRLPTAAVMFEGLSKLYVLLDALESDDFAESNGGLNSQIQETGTAK